MIPDPSQVIVTTEDYPVRYVRALSVYHRDFPEVRGEGGSPEDAAGRLTALLSRTLDSAPSDRRRDLFESPIDDVRAFAKRDRSGSGCGPSAIPRRDEDSQS